MDENRKILQIVTPLILVAVLLAVVLIATRKPERSQELPDIYLDAGVIKIAKQDSTLAEIARAMDDPAIFEYDKKNHKALTQAHMLIEKGASLKIGSADQPELLEFNTTVCGDASITVQEGGELSIINSEIATKDRTISQGVCTRGYTMFCYGKLTIKDSRLLYLSGNKSRVLAGNASADLDTVTIARSDGTSMRMVEVDGSRITIRNCEFLTSADYGIYVVGSTKEPVRLENTTLTGTAADVFLSRGAGEVVLVDCVFRKEHVLFENSEGRVIVKRRVPVSIEVNGEPASRARVVVEGGSQFISTETDVNGQANLELTECIIEPGSKITAVSNVAKIYQDGKLVGQQQVPVAADTTRAVTLSFATEE